jgi:hypothetical protein
MELNRDLALKVVGGVLVLYVLCKLLFSNTEGMTFFNAHWKTPQYAYPSTYPAFYKQFQLDIIPDGQCQVGSLQIDKNCVNKRLLESGGDLSESIRKCRRHNSDASSDASGQNIKNFNPDGYYEDLKKDRMYRHLVTGYPETMRIMPLTIPAVSQEVPTYEAMSHRRY